MKKRSCSLLKTPLTEILQIGERLSRTTTVESREMKTILVLLASASLVIAQGGPRPTDLGASPLPIGEPGIAWYTTWDTGLAEAKRSNRPIFFMAAAATCNGVSGVF